MPDGECPCSKLCGRLVGPKESNRERRVRATRSACTLQRPPGHRPLWRLNQLWGEELCCETLRSRNRVSGARPSDIGRPEMEITLPRRPQQAYAYQGVDAGSSMSATKSNRVKIYFELPEE